MALSRDQVIDAIDAALGARTLYGVLGLPCPLSSVPTGSTDGGGSTGGESEMTLDRAYRRRTLLLHPDRIANALQEGRGPEPSSPSTAESVLESSTAESDLGERAKRALLLVQDAHRILSDSDKRAAYDVAVAAVRSGSATSVEATLAMQQDPEAARRALERRAAAMEMLFASFRMTTATSGTSTAAAAARCSCGAPLEGAPPTAAGGPSSGLAMCRACTTLHKPLSRCRTLGCLRDAIKDTTHKETATTAASNAPTSAASRPSISFFASGSGTASSSNGPAATFASASAATSTSAATGPSTAAPSAVSAYMSVLRPSMSSTSTSSSSSFGIINSSNTSIGMGPRATLYTGAPSVLADAAAGMSRAGSSSKDGAGASSTSGATNAPPLHPDSVGLCEMCAARRKCGKFGCLRPIGSVTEGFCPLHVPK